MTAEEKAKLVNSSIPRHLDPEWRNQGKVKTVPVGIIAQVPYQGFFDL